MHRYVQGAVYSFGVECASIIAVVVAILVMGGFAEAQGEQPLKVAYTGRLFGYHRIEPGEQDAAGNATPALMAVQQFLKWRPTDALLVGMGDNFGPEFGASIQEEYKPSGITNDPCAAPLTYPSGPLDPQRWKFEAPEGIYKSGSRLAFKADCDNVVRFLLESGYSALVPGREDFLY